MMSCLRGKSSPWDTANWSASFLKANPLKGNRTAGHSECSCKALLLAAHQKAVCRQHPGWPLPCWLHLLMPSWEAHTMKSPGIHSSCLFHRSSKEETECLHKEEKTKIFPCTALEPQDHSFPRDFSSWLLLANMMKTKVLKMKTLATAYCSLIKRNKEIWSVFYLFSSLCSQ